MNTVFSGFCHGDYQQVCDFLIGLNRQSHDHINWNWARWEWMYSHPYFDGSKAHTIGLWKCGAQIVGAAVYDLFYGEALCAALPGYEALLPEIVTYAWENLGNENGLAVAVNDRDTGMQNLLTGMGFAPREEKETMLRAELAQIRAPELPEGYCLRELRFPEDDLAYQTVIWKGFGHEGDMAELDRMLRNPNPLPIHREPYLCLGIGDSTGELAAHCTCWFDRRTDYAYVEPACTIPGYRGLGLGRAVVLHALSRCAALGAKSAYVLSDQEFYRKLGFRFHSGFTFYGRPAAAGKKTEPEHQKVT